MKSSIFVFVLVLFSLQAKAQYYNFGIGSSGVFAAPDYVHSPGYPNGAVTVDFLENDLSTENPEAVLMFGNIIRYPVGGSTWVSWDDNLYPTIGYSPNRYFSGVDTLLYTVGDNEGFAVGMLTINVASSQIVAAPDLVNMSAGATVEIDVLANDHNPLGEPLHITNLYSWLGDASVVTRPDGRSVVQFAPVINFTGINLLFYQASDDMGIISEEAQVSTLIIGQAPVAQPDVTSVTQGQRVTLDVLLNDTDPEYDNLKLVSIGRAPLNGEAFIDCVYTTCKVTYVASSTFMAQDTFTYKMVAGYGPISEGKVTINMVNQPPQAVNDSYTVNNRTSTTLNVLNNDIEPNGQALTIVSVTNPKNGHVTIVGQAIVFKPKAGAKGADSFNYTISDGTYQSTATVNLNITK